MKIRKGMSLVLLVWAGLCFGGCTPLANSWVKFVDENKVARMLNPRNMGKDEKEKLPEPVRNAMGMREEPAAKK